MTTTPHPGTRDESATRTRLLDAAARLFYDEGVNVGVAALCREAGVSKRSMYQYFASKDEVLAESLARSVPGYLASLLPPAPEALEPRERILAVFARVEAIAAEPGFRGCPYVSVASEVKAQEHPARAVARRFHDTLTAFFRTAAAEAGVTDPEALARQLTATQDGTLASAVMQGGPIDGLAVAMATALLDAWGVTGAGRGSPT